MKIHGAFAACLSQIDREIRKLGPACDIGLHDFRTACKECNIDVIEGGRRNDLRDLNLSREFLQQTGVLFRFQQYKPANRQASALEHLS